MNPGRSVLHKIGVRLGTDKVDKWHTTYDSSYLDVYDKYFLPLRCKSINILEIGVRGGNSLRTWKKYFPKAAIYGIDLDQGCSIHAENRIKIFIGDQADELFINNIVKDGLNFDIIIDDGSHINELTIKSFNILYPFLKYGGLYIIEDLGTSYDDLNDVVNLWGNELKANKNRGVDLNNKREDIEKLFLTKIRELDKTKGSIEYIHFYSQLALIKKVTIY